MISPVLHVHDDAGAALGAEIADDLGQFLVQDELHPGVERQLHRPARCSCTVLVERPLDAGEPVIVDAAKPDDMRGQIAERIDPALLVLELQARDAEAVDLVLLARRQAPLDPDKALARGQLGVQLGRVELRQNRGDGPRRLARIEDLARVGIERRAVERRRQQLAVAVEDIGAHRRRRRGGPAAESARHATSAVAARHSATISTRRSADDQEHEREHRRRQRPAGCGRSRAAPPGARR